MSKKDKEEEIIFEDDSVSFAGKEKKLRDKLKACEKEKQEHLDGWQRARADFINLQKRSREDILKAREEGIFECLESVLEVLDSLDRALENTNLDEVSKEGIEMVRKQMMSVLAKYGVEVINPLGEEADPEMHHTIGTDEGGEEGTVSAVIQKGYKTKDRIVRPASVKVFANLN